MTKIQKFIIIINKYIRSFNVCIKKAFGSSFVTASHELCIRQVFISNVVCVRVSQCGDFRLFVFFFLRKLRNDSWIIVLKLPGSVKSFVSYRWRHFAAVIARLFLHFSPYLLRRPQTRETEERKGLKLLVSFCRDRMWHWKLARDTRHSVAPGFPSLLIMFSDCSDGTPAGTSPYYIRCKYSPIHSPNFTHSPDR